MSHGGNGGRAARKIAVLAHIHRLNLAILPVPNDLIYEAAEYKAEYTMSCADCFVLTCALRYNADIVTGDPEFNRVKHLVGIHWV